MTVLLQFYQQFYQLIWFIILFIGVIILVCTAFVLSFLNEPTNNYYGKSIISKRDY